MMMKFEVSKEEFALIVEIANLDHESGKLVGSFHPRYATKA